MEQVGTDDWTPQTIASWRHSIWVGCWDPWPVFSRPKIWYKTLRDIICLVGADGQCSPRYVIPV
jgi:MPBQ/MSBQ methyltransferase